jgi:hypothetical protein
MEKSFGRIKNWLDSPFDDKPSKIGVWIDKHPLLFWTIFLVAAPFATIFVIAIAVLLVGAPPPF